MTLKVKKTVKAKIMYLTKVKQLLLENEYEALQRFLRGEKAELYSANRQQAKRFYRKVKPNKEYPLSIRKDLLKVERRNTKIAEYWARIPVKGRRGGVWVAIKPHCPITPDMEICESKLFKRDGDFYLHMTVQKDVKVPKPELDEKTVVIACDIGEANPITTVELWNYGTERRNVHFLGKEIRGIRTLYSRIRKVIGRKKVKHGAKVLDRMDKESRKVRDVLHKATRKVVERAKKLKEEGYKPIITYGDLKHVRKPRIKGKTRCRKNNRKTHSMPSHKIKHMLTYKALWEEIPVVPLNEAYTSQLCWRCGSLNTETKKRRLLCKDCGLEYNRDLNGAVNIGNRLLGYMLKSRGGGDLPLTSPKFTAPKGDYVAFQYAREEAPALAG
ncbi:MAG: RNA-guided endonuclease InsQ/TnpB family protein, partial [Candidatus Bathyarchaeales archaeon]